MAIGHNSLPGDQLKSIIERIENLIQEKQALQGDISDLFGEAKGNGFDTKAIRQLIKLRKKSAAQREEEEMVLDTYMHAIGMKALME